MLSSHFNLFSHTLDLEPEPSHATPVLIYCRLAVLLGIGGVREKHALVTLGLFILAHTAGLSVRLVSSFHVQNPGFVGAPWVSTRRRSLGPR
jgi:hypothetical protein